MNKIKLVEDRDPLLAISSNYLILGANIIEGKIKSNTNIFLNGQLVGQIYKIIGGGIDLTISMDNYPHHYTDSITNDFVQKIYEQKIPVAVMILNQNPRRFSFEKGQILTINNLVNPPIDDNDVRYEDEEMIEKSDWIVISKEDYNEFKAGNIDKICSKYNYDHPQPMVKHTATGYYLGYKTIYYERKPETGIKHIFNYVSK